MMTLTTFYVRDKFDTSIVQATSPEQAAEKFMYSLEDLPLQQRFYLSVAESANGPFESYVIWCQIVQEFSAYKI